MNLIKKSIDSPENSILRLREHQHSQIDQFILLGMQYLKKNGFQHYDENISTFEVLDTHVYQNIGFFATKTIKIKLNPNLKENFLSMAVPQLLNGAFYKLNSVNYIPIFFISDLPIVKKPKSCKFYSLFCPITLFFKDHTAIIYGNNIPISRFLSLFYDPIKLKDLASQFSFTIINEPMNITLNYFAKMFNTQPNVESVLERINMLFFDTWTENLYKTCYNLEYVNLQIIVDLLFDKMEAPNDDPLNFIDLRSKRLLYAETLLIPYFRAISDATKALLKGQQPFKLNLTISTIIEHFFGTLNKLNLYDVTSGYSSVLELKATYENPYSNGELPISVSLIHDSYYEKVCTVSVSNTDTGKVISLVPNQNINLNYGLFDFGN